MIWDDAQVFLAVARKGALSAAAAELKVGVATVSRRIQRLEGALGVPLFARQQSGYQLTEDGADLVAKAEAMEAAALSFASGAAERQEVSGTVRLATGENFAAVLIIPALKDLRERHPKLSIEIFTDVAPVNLHRRDADLALRKVKPERGNLNFQRLGVLGYGLYGSPEYLRALHLEPNAKSWRDADFITWSKTQAHLASAQWVSQTLQGRAPVVLTTSLAAQISAARAGLGLVVAPHFLAKEAGLTCAQDTPQLDQTMYLVLHSDLAQSARVRVVADFLRDLVYAQRERLEGRSD